LTEAPDKHGPGVRIPPPVLTATVIFTAYLIDFYFPFRLNESTLFIPGVALISLACLIALLAVIRFLKFKTHVEPWKPTSTIITTGVYRFSRNPIYLAFAIINVGIGFLLNSGWILFSVVALIPLLQVVVISREERYLETKFGEDYLQYKRRVRRWI
jgi:protein-S-isoprenylcysteine O-methyltransferase Ste14